MNGFSGEAGGEAGVQCAAAAFRDGLISRVGELECVINRLDAEGSGAGEVLAASSIAVEVNACAGVGVGCVFLVIRALQLSTFTTSWTLLY